MKSSLRSHVRRGVTALDVVVAGAILAIGCCLLFPALHEQRQLADLNVCQENLQSLSKAFQKFEQKQGGFPARRTGGFGNTPYGGWGVQLLAHLDEKLNSEFHHDYDYFDEINKKVVETKIKTFICPAAPRDRSLLIRSNASAASANPNKDQLFEANCGPNDYISSNGFFMPSTGYGVGWPDGLGNQRQAMTDSEVAPLTRITDGLSNTILIVEKAGSPATYRLGKQTDANNLFNGQNNSRGVWAGYGSIAWGPMNGKTGERPARGDSTDCTVNCNNTFGIYGFHEKGANILLCDGAVRFVTNKLDGLTLGRLTMRDDGQLLSDDAF